MATGLQKLLKIESGELAAVGLTLLLSIFLGIPTLFTVTVGGAIFLAKFSADNLPLVYIAASLVLPLVGLVHLACARRMSFVRLQLGTLLVLATMSGLFLLLLDRVDASWPAFLLFVWCGAELHLSALVMWSTASRLFTVRQGKRLFGLVGSGEIIAAIIGGALTPILTRHVGTVVLLSLSLIGFLLAFLCMAWMTRLFGPRLVHEAEERAPSKNVRQDRLLDLFKSRYLGLIFLTYALVLSSGFFVNNIFYYQIAEQFTSADQMASFLGGFFAVFALLSLFFRSLLSSRILLRFGLPGGLLSTPVAVFLGALVVLGLGLAGAAPVQLFWAIVVLRLFERLFMGSFGQPAYYTLYQPLSRERRARVQTTAETISGPLAGGLTGVILLVLTKVFHLTSVGLAAALLPLLIAWIVICILAGRGFRDALTSALKRRGISGSDLTVSDPTSLKLLEKGLESRRSIEVLYCLHLLEAAVHPRFQELLLDLVDHEDAEVRRGVYEILERLGERGAFAKLVNRLEGEDDELARGVLLRALGSTGGVEAAGKIRREVAGQAPAVRRGALVGLIRSCGPEVAAEAEAIVAQVGAASDPAERSLAAEVIGELALTNLLSIQMALMVDPEPSVRRAAMESLGERGATGVWRLVIGNLDHADVKTDALKALLKGGDAAFPALESVFGKAGTSRTIKVLILKVLGRSKSQSGIEFLLRGMLAEDRTILAEVLWSLHLCEFQASSGQRAAVEKCLKREVGYGDQLIATARDLTHEPGAALLVAALEQELSRTRKRCFLLLSFLYDAETLMKIWSNFGGTAALRDLALELFEDRVEKRHSALVMPLLAGKSDLEKESATDRLVEILFGSDLWADSWTRATAVDAAAAHGEGLSDDQRQLLMKDANRLIADTAVARFSESDDRETLPVIDRVRNVRGASIFREIDDEVLADLAQRLDEVWVEAGEAVYSQGDPGGTMFIVSEGLLRLHVGDEALAELRPGEIFGELSSLEVEARSESATAVERSRLFRLSAEDLHAFMSTRIEVVRGIVAVLCQRVRLAPTDKLAGKEEKERAETPPVEVDVYGDDYLSSLEKVLILKTADIFSKVADDILAGVAERTKEVRLKRNELLFSKGDPGTTTYIVAAGRIRIHIGDKWIADAAERAVVGELAALSSEPRTASVTAADASLLLALDQESLFELMWDQQEIVRGIIRVLVARLRRLHRLVQD